MNSHIQFLIFIDRTRWLSKSFDLELWRIKISVYSARSVLQEPGRNYSPKHLRALIPAVLHHIRICSNPHIDWQWNNGITLIIQVFFFSLKTSSSYNVQSSLLLLLFLFFFFHSLSFSSIVYLTLNFFITASWIVDGYLFIVITFNLSLQLRTPIKTSDGNKLIR